MNAAKLTRQGVRDLGGNVRTREPTIFAKCDHIWERIVRRDELTGRPTTHRRCALCHEAQS